MIALMASALLGLYLLLPVFLFEKAAQPFVRLKRHQRTKLEEFVAGILVAAIPLAFTSIVLWHTERPSSAYQTVINSLYSEHYFDTHTAEFWVALRQVCHHQAHLLVWNYFFLLLEIAIVFVCVWQFGRLNQYKIFKHTFGKFLLKRVSEWEPLLTPFVFHPSERRRVEVDLMTSDGNLYRGTVEEHFVDKDGDLRGLLLKDASRYQYAKLQREREQKRERPLSDYWKRIPGSNLYVPFEKMVTLNLRYELPDQDLLRRLREKLQQIGMGDLVIERTKKARREHREES